MTDLVEFLTDRYDEAESGWRAHRRAEVDGCIKPVFHFGRPLAEEMLADIAAKRAIIALHTPNSELCFWTNEGWRTHDDVVCDTLRLLASIYSDHSDYDESWRP